MLVSLGLLLLSCTSGVENDGTNIVAISTDSIRTIKEVLNRIELIPLDSIDEAQIGKLDRVKTYEDFFLLGDRSDILYLFKRDGSFCANSKKVFGKGSGEYSLCLAYSYNKYRREIEVVVPDGIMFYDCNFKFIRKVKFEDKHMRSLMFNHLYDLSKDKHILMSPNEKENPHYYVFDSNEGRMIKSIAYPVDCKEITMQQQCISDKRFIAFPSMNYSFYMIDENDYNYKQVVKLDFGDKSLNMDDYKRIDGIDKKQKFLMESNNTLPLRAYRSANDLAIVLKEGKLREDLHLLILNIESQESTTIVSCQNDIKLPLMDFYEDKVIYSFVTSEELKEYVAEDLLDDKSKKAYATISDASNYCLLKYHLK